MEDQKAAYDALAGSITAAAIAKGLEESNANASKEYGKTMDKAFEGVQDKFIKKFGREAGIAYFTEFRAGLNSEIPELKERAQEIYRMFDENTTKTRTTMAGNRPVVSEYVEVSNELESTLNKVRDATDQYNETLSANKIAMKTLMDMYKISADDINGQGEAIKDLIKRKEQELADINKEIATTEDEIISRNKRVEAVENEIKRLKELGRTNEKAQEAANKIARQAAKTQLDLEKQLLKSILELRQASLEKDLELSRLRFSWERQELENKLKYDKTLTAESREAINQLILNMEERRYKEESEIRQRWSDKELEEEARNAENRIKMRFNAQNKLQTIRQKEAQLPNYDILHTSDPNKDIEKNAAKMDIAQQQMDAAQNKLSEIQSMSEETYTALYGGVLEWRNAELDAQKAVAEAKQQVNDIQLQGIKLQEKETQMSIQSAQQMVGALEELAEAAGADAGVVAMLAIAESAAAMGTALHKAFSSSATVWDGIAGAVAAISTITTIITQIKSLNSSAEEERSKYRYASGGLVTGPGTGTSDSIPAMLSNGEAVMTAQAVNDWGAMLSAMNVASGGNAIQVSNLPQRNDGMRGMKAMIREAMLEMPAPRVAVVDIIKGEKRVKVQNSLGKLGRKNTNNNMNTPNKRVGRPRAYTPEALEAKFEEYVEWVKANPVYINKVSAGEIIPVPTQRPLTLVGFCQFARISKDTFRRYEDEFCDLLTHVRVAIEADQLEGALCGQYDSGIVARVLHLADRQDVTTNGKAITAATQPISVVLDPEAAKIIQSIGKMTVKE